MYGLQQALERLTRFVDGESAHAARTDVQRVLRAYRSLEAQEIAVRTVVHQLVEAVGGLDEEDY